MTSRDNHTPDSSERRRNERRRGFTSLLHPERRLGFDRRNEGRGGPWGRALEQLRDSGLALALVLGAINALNLLDLLLTFRLLDDGAVEGNLFMRVLIDSGPVAALFVKVLIVGGVSFAIWRQRRYRLILATSLLVLAVFVVLTAYELRLIVGG